MLRVLSNSLKACFFSPSLGRKCSLFQWLNWRIIHIKNLNIHGNRDKDSWRLWEIIFTLPFHYSGYLNIPWKQLQQERTRALYQRIYGLDGLEMRSVERRLSCFLFFSQKGTGCWSVLVECSSQVNIVDRETETLHPGTLQKTHPCLHHCPTGLGT